MWRSGDMPPRNMGAFSDVVGHGSKLIETCVFSEQRMRVERERERGIDNTTKGTDS
jgi:hypothetical protein